ncbi:MAG: ExeA family protein [Blastopirellula sp. JB062]
MYEDHWNLTVRPFENTAIPAFYYPAESSQGTLLKLRYAVENRRGAALLTGGEGLGKTLMAQLLLEQLPEQFTPKTHVVFPYMPADQLLAYVVRELVGVEQSATSTIADSVQALRRGLSENTRAGNHAVLVIDEAHLVADFNALETLRLLTNLETDGMLDLTLLLVGQTEILPSLRRMPALETRLAVKCMVKPLSADETALYVLHRLTTAGARREIFTADALDRLHQITNGAPRRINRLCDLAMLIAFAEEQSEITAEQIEAVHEELVAVSTA